MFKQHISQQKLSSLSRKTTTKLGANRWQRGRFLEYPFFRSAFYDLPLLTNVWADLLQRLCLTASVYCRSLLPFIANCAPCVSLHQTG